MSEKERPQQYLSIMKLIPDKPVRLGDVVDQFKGKAIPAEAETAESLQLLTSRI